MDFSKFTTKSQLAINEANQLSVANKNQLIENGHLLKAMLQVDKNVTPHLLNKFGVNMNVFKQALDGIIQSYPIVTGGQANLSRNTQSSLSNAIELAKKMQDDFISLEHLLLGILNSSDGVSQLLKDNGVNRKDLKAAITELRNGERVTSSGQEDTYNSLEKYAVNLNKKAKDGKLDPVIGRDEEIRRVLQIITRKTNSSTRISK